MNLSLVSFGKISACSFKLSSFCFYLLFLISKSVKNILRNSFKILRHFKSNKALLFKFYIYFCTVLFRSSNKHMSFIFAKGNDNCTYSKFFFHLIKKCGINFTYTQRKERKVINFAERNLKVCKSKRFFIGICTFCNLVIFFFYFFTKFVVCFYKTCCCIAVFLCGARSIFDIKLRIIERNTKIYRSISKACIKV